MTAPMAKETELQSVLASLGSVIVAYSGGVDSAYLALVANRTLGARALAVTADSPSYPERHRRIAIQIAEQFGLRHEIIHTSELERPEYRANGANRCYYCKHELYTHLTRIAAGRWLTYSCASLRMSLAAMPVHCATFSGGYSCTRSRSASNPCVYLLT